MLDTVCIFVDSNVIVKLFGMLYTFVYHFECIYLLITNKDMFEFIRIHPLYSHYKNRIKIVTYEPSKNDIQLDKFVFAYEEISKSHPKCLFLSTPVLFIKKNNQLFENEKIAFLEFDTFDVSNIQNQHSKKLTNHIFYVSEKKSIYAFRDLVRNNLDNIRSKTVDIQTLMMQMNQEFNVQHSIQPNCYLGIFNFFQNVDTVTIDSLKDDKLMFFEVDRPNMKPLQSRITNIMIELLKIYPYLKPYFIINYMNIKLPMQFKLPGNSSTRSSLQELIEMNKSYWYWNVQECAVPQLQLFEDVVIINENDHTKLNNSIINKKVLLENYSETMLDVLNMNNINYDFFGYIPYHVDELELFITDRKIIKTKQCAVYDEIIILRDISYCEYLQNLSECTYASLKIVDCVFIAECIALNVVLVTDLDLLGLVESVHYIRSIHESKNTDTIVDNLKHYYKANLSKEVILKRIFLICIDNGTKIPEYER